MDDLDGPRTAGVTILLPVFNDWSALALLLARLDGVLAAGGLAADVLVADDGSTEDLPAGRFAGPWESFGRIEVLHYPSLLRARAAETAPQPVPGRRAVA